MPSMKLYFTNNTVFIFTLLLFIFTRFMCIEAQSLWLDEINLARIALELKFSLNPSETVKNIFDLIKIEPHPPLYFILSKLWISLFGSGTIALRALGAIWLIVLFILLGLWPRRKFGSRFAHVLLLLMTFLPAFLDEAQNFRPYAFLMLMGGAITIAYVEFMRNGRRHQALLALCLLVMTAALTHYAAVIFALAVAGHQFISGIVKQPGKYPRWFTVSAIIMLATVPALIWYGATLSDMYARQVHDLSRSPELKDYISPVWAFFSYPGLLIVLLLPALSGPQNLVQQGKVIFAKLARDDLFVSCLSIGALHFVLTALAALAQPSLLQNKNMLIAFPALLIAFGRYIMAFADEPRAFRLTFVAGLAGFVFFLVAGHSRQFTYFQPWREQVREGAEFIQSSAKPGDIVMLGTVSMNGYWLQPLKSYLSLTGGQTGPWREVEVITFPPVRDRSVIQKNFSEELGRDRLALLAGALDKIGRDPSKRLFLDLPHASGLFAAERELLSGAGVCIKTAAFFNQQVMLIEKLAAPASCAALEY